MERQSMKRIDERNKNRQETSAVQITQPICTAIKNRANEFIGL